MLVVLAIGALLVGWKVVEQIRIGVSWDTYAFLANAAEFAGRGIGYDEPHRPAVLSLLTSLFFRVLPLSAWPIQVVDGLISFSGVPALYLLLRRRVAQAPAAMGALGMLAMQPVWFWLGVGYSDLASMALTVWTLVFAVKATEDDPRWYAAAFPALVIASLTRVTALFGVFAVLLWIALRGRPFAHARQLAIGLAAAALAYVPAGLYYSDRFGDILFPYLVYLTMANEQISRGVVGAAIEPGGWQTVPGTVLVVVAWIAALGVAALAARYLREHRPRGRSLLLIAAGIGIAAAGQLAGGLFARQGTLFIGAYIVSRALAHRETEGPRAGMAAAVPALDATLLLLALAYLDFHGHQPVKVWRYFIVFAPAAMYFLAVGWGQVAHGAGRLLAAVAPRAGGRPSQGKVGAVAAWAVLGLVLAGLAADNLAATMRTAPDPLTLDAERTAAWIRAREPRPADLTIYSDVWPITSWYLGAQARAMPTFPDTRAFPHELSKRRADYYVTLSDRRYEPYFATAYESGEVAVLTRTRPDTSTRPTVRYMGKAWENYVETVDDFDIDLFYDGGFEGWAGSVFLDAYPVSELERYNAVAVYRVRWYDRGNAERVLDEYLRAGGTVLLDASGNLAGADYPMLDTIMFDTVVRRRGVPADAVLAPSPGFAARHPGLPAAAEGEWIDESGGAWFGADYEPVPGAPARETLLTLDGRPVVTVQKVGRGRMFWIGANLMWHAFKRGGGAEHDLVKAVLAEALDRAPLSAEPVDGLSQPGEARR